MSMDRPPVKVSEEVDSNSIVKSDINKAVVDGNYGPSAETDYYAQTVSTGYVVTKAPSSGIVPISYTPTSDAELIQLVQQDFNQPSITTLAEALEYLTNADAMVSHNNKNTPIDNFPPELPMDGLSMYLDSQISASAYVGDSTSWFDVSGNGIEFEPKSGGLSKEFLGGYCAYQFDGSGYYEAVLSHSPIVNMGGDCTLVMAVWCTQITERDTIFEKKGDSGPQSYKQEIAVTWETSEAFSYYSRKTPNYDHANTAACDTNSGEGAWTIMAIKMTTGLTSTARTGFYSKNGANWVASYNSRSNTALDPALNVRVGYGYAGAVEGPNGIGAVLCYNKALSNSEISDVYDALKGRYGLS
tara:strand:+ start:178 stop:1248 length:1071 start_codon:yes stop_codon:yes gene_type:complete